MSDLLRQTLEDWARAGVSGIGRIDPETLPPLQPATAADVTDEPTGEPTEESPRVPSSPASDVPPGGDAAAQLAILEEQVAQCVKCPDLAATRTQTVFGTGDPNASILLLGEAPGADEDKTGEPFVGRAGKLLNDIIDACGWSRQQLYICNVLRCRPPGNRNPSREEAANCRGWLDGQIAAVRPDWIICWGSVPAKELLDTKKAIGKLRGQLFDHAYEGGSAKVLCTYHPSYLLRNPPAKKDVWADLKFLLAEMGTPVEKRS